MYIYHSAHGIAVDERARSRETVNAGRQASHTCSAGRSMIHSVTDAKRSVAYYYTYHADAAECRIFYSWLMGTMIQESS